MANSSPKFIYSCEPWSKRLHRTDLVTGETSSHGVQHTLISSSSWTELPRGSLLFIGGGFNHITNDVTRVDVLRDCADCTEPPMLTNRWSHCAVYHTITSMY
jgi:hypothetical protein